MMYAVTSVIKIRYSLFLTWPKITFLSILIIFSSQTLSSPTSENPIIPEIRNDLLQPNPFIHIPGPNPILRVSQKPGWDDGVLETAGIFKDFGTYYLYYHATGAGKGYQVGVATTSHPLGPFKRYEGNPILQIGEKGSWEDIHVACAIIIKEGVDKFYMWYCGHGTKHKNPDGSFGGIWDIGLATSSHPLGPWHKYENNPVIQDFGYVSAVVKANDKYYLYTAHPIDLTGPDYSPMAVATAEKPEGPWVKYSGNPILQEGEWGEWDDGGFSDAAVIYHSGIFHMFPAGAKLYSPRIKTRESLGYAYSFDGYHFIKYGRNPIASRNTNPNAASFSEPRVLIEMPYIYVYHTLRYKQENPPYANLEDIGVQVLVTETGFSFDMPVLVRETLDAGAITILEDSPPVSLSNVKRLALTAECRYTEKADEAILIHVISSPNGIKYDTSDLFLLKNNFEPGKTVRKTFDLQTNVRFIKVLVENPDKTEAVSDIFITATLGS
ncbi:hypothetical protein ACFL1G_05520 [Planctomycetota bacterium]